jgi:hypothetical protein
MLQAFRDAPVIEPLGGGEGFEAQAVILDPWDAEGTEKLGCGAEDEGGDGNGGDGLQNGAAAACGASASGATGKASARARSLDGSSSLPTMIRASIPTAGPSPWDTLWA